MKFKPLFFFALTFGLLTAGMSAQTVLLPIPSAPYFNSDGSIDALGKLYTCSAGSTCPGTPQATYSDSTGLVQNQNPIPLNSGGYPTNATGSIVGVWLTPATAYKICLQNYAGQTQWCSDNVTGLATTSSAAAQSTTQVTYSATPTFTMLAQNQLFEMTLTGNVTSSSLVASGISTPAYLTFQLTQDATGGRTFVWPGNFQSGCSITPDANSVTTQTFYWDGTTAHSVGQCSTNGQQQGITGEVRMFGGTSAPTGWLFCQGQAISRTTYANLFNVLGTTFGTGDGSTTFNIPDLRGRVPIGVGQGSGLTNRTLAATGGEETHVLSVAEMPVHNHGSGTIAVSENHTWTNGTPQQGSTNTASNGTGTTITQGSNARTDFSQTFTVSGSTANAGSGAAHNNMQPFLVLNYICKY